MKADMNPAGQTYIQSTEDGYYLLVKAQPGAKKSEICDESDGMLRIRLSAPAVDNKANAALVEFVAEKLKVRKNKIVLVSGEKSRKKRLFIPSDTSPDLAALAPDPTKI
ncbi:DUF167 domain-containing protein [Desulfovibrio sp. OttesenSCG-928-C14]|nr:DUF167 domain-containing protein [Desulfovibrio sp. OttesenSCG-928-C14]